MLSMIVWSIVFITLSFFIFILFDTWIIYALSWLKIYKVEELSKKSVDETVDIDLSVNPVPVSFGFPAGHDMEKSKKTINTILTSIGDEWKEISFKDDTDGLFAKYEVNKGKSISGFALLQKSFKKNKVESLNIKREDGSSKLLVSFEFKPDAIVERCKATMKSILDSMGSDWEEIEFNSENGVGAEYRGTPNEFYNDSFGK